MGAGNSTPVKCSCGSDAVVKIIATEKESS